MQIYFNASFKTSVLIDPIGTPVNSPMGILFYPSRVSAWMMAQHEIVINFN